MTTVNGLPAPRSAVVSAVVAVLAVVVGAAGVHGMYRIGDSGSKAAWTGKFSTTGNEPGLGGPGRD